MFDSLEAAIADCIIVLARPRAPMIRPSRLSGPTQAAVFLAPHVTAGENVAVLFGRERYGLENDEVALADRIITFPVNPAFASLNLAQAVAIVAYEWFKHACGGALPFAMPERSEPASKQQIQAFFSNLERQLDLIEYFRPIDKRATMLVNLRNIFARMQPSRQDIQTLHGIVMALTEGRKGPARGGVLDGEEAAALRALLAEYGDGARAGRTWPGARPGAAPAPQPDRCRAAALAGTHQRPSLAGMGFKRQTPIGTPHRRFRLVPAANGYRAACPRAKARGGEDSRRSTNLADRARLSRCRRGRARSRDRPAANGRPPGDRLAIGQADE